MIDAPLTPAERIRTKEQILKIEELRADKGWHRDAIVLLEQLPISDHSALYLLQLQRKQNLELVMEPRNNDAPPPRLPRRTRLRILWQLFWNGDL